MKIFNQQGGLILETEILQGADLQGADLRGANLQGADLQGADLRRANLREASLSEADLRGANLRGANLRGANLRGANLSEAYLPHFQIPQSGTLRVWKKLREGYIAELEVYASSPRTASLAGRKCRARKVKVLNIFSRTGERQGPGIPFSSSYDLHFKYRVGETIEEKDYNNDIRIECAPGIHFFLTREEAEEYP